MVSSIQQADAGDMHVANFPLLRSDLPPVSILHVGKELLALRDSGNYLAFFAFFLATNIAVSIRIINDSSVSKTCRQFRCAVLCRCKGLIGASESLRLCKTHV